jgi:hypothetical protein
MVRPNKEVMSLDSLKPALNVFYSSTLYPLVHTFILFFRRQKCYLEMLDGGFYG